MKKIAVNTDINRFFLVENVRKVPKISNHLYYSISVVRVIAHFRNLTFLGLPSFFTAAPYEVTINRHYPVCKMVR